MPKSTHEPLDSGWYERFAEEIDKPENQSRRSDFARRTSAELKKLHKECCPDGKFWKHNYADAAHS